MMRGTFANVRLRNLLAPGTEGGVTVHLPEKKQMSIYDAAMQYQKEGVPLIVIAGKEYGTGSSRDWAAKGPRLLGIKAAVAESFERIHRSNLIGMGILPLQFKAGENLKSLGLSGFEKFERRWNFVRAQTATRTHCKGDQRRRQGHGVQSHLPYRYPGGIRLLPAWRDFGVRAAPAVAELAMSSYEF